MECEFPTCDKDRVGTGLRCLLHENVLISASYLNTLEVTDD